MFICCNVSKAIYATSTPKVLDIIPHFSHDKIVGHQGIASSLPIVTPNKRHKSNQYHLLLALNATQCVQTALHNPKRKKKKENAMKREWVKVRISRITSQPKRQTYRQSQSSSDRRHSHRRLPSHSRFHSRYHVHLRLDFRSRCHCHQ